MPISTDLHQIKGMQKDISVSKASSEFAFDAKNIRITARDSNTMLSITNEKGNKEIPLYSGGIPTSIEGTIIGYNILKDFIVLFTSSLVDRIYRLEYKGSYFELLLLYEGLLNFNVNNPIESIYVYENENIQKIYWVDGINQPRVINIVAEADVRNKWNANSFDFVQNLSLKEEVLIEKTSTSSGKFNSGTIQYAFTYYNKYGQESNIVYTSSLNYISSLNRGSSPEERVSNSFIITINNVDTKFDFIRIYSIHRTSLNATPTVKKIIDLPTDQEGSSIKYVDNGTSGEFIDPTELLYIGGETIIANTITQKDNTLFLGNIKINRPSIPESIKNSLKTEATNKLKSSLRNVRAELDFEDAYYKYINFLNKGNTAGYKAGEHYRLGLQFQYNTGKWSEPVFLHDYTINEGVRPDLSIADHVGTLSIPQIEYTLDSEICDSLRELGYVNVRPVVVFPSMQDRKIVTQGMLCPTVFNILNRNNNTPFSQSSWFLRPYQPWQIDTSESNMSNNDNIDKGAWVEFRHHYGIFTGKNRGAEIQNIDYNSGREYSLNFVNSVDSCPDTFLIDQSIISLHSPDIEFDDSIQTLDSSNLKLRIVGAVNFTANVGDIDIQTSSPVIHPTKATGFVHRTIGVEGNSNLAARSLVSGLFYKDWLVDDKSENKFGYYTKQTEEASWMIYPWQKTGSINNDINRKDGTRTSVLSKKKISNLKFSDFNIWFNPTKYWYAESSDDLHNGITNVQLFNSNEVSLVKIPTPSNSPLKSINYYGNVDTLLVSKDSYSQYFAGALTSGDSQIIEPTKEVNWFNADFKETRLTTVDMLSNLGDYEDNIVSTKDPVRMKYKSSPHFVFSINYTKESKSQMILPTTHGNEGAPINQIIDSTVPFWINKVSSKPSGSFIDLKLVWRGDIDYARYHWTVVDVWEYNDLYYDNYNQLLYRYNSSMGEDFPFELVTDPRIYGSLFKYVEYDVSYYYDVRYNAVKGYYLYEYDVTTSTDAEFSVKQDVIEEAIKYPYLFIGELYREDSDIPNAFGGNTNDALLSNQWLPAGNPEFLCPNGLTVKFIYGDTWYQRYDCLKTYPFTLEDENSVVEIGSFMCETRVNIDGRYDRNRGQVSNLNMTPNNFNLFNDVYTQRDNFFNYRILDDSFYKLNSFTNTITWTKEKQLGEFVDTWTNITMASTLDLDGDKGDITSLNTFNNEIYCFQEKGFSNILFNPRVQIPTSDGVPIEISNGSKVGGKRYISNNIGCTNKWSIVEALSGLYFIDNNTSSINLYNGQIQSLSNSLGFSSWMNNNNTMEVWSPVNYSNFINYYDKANGDIYFINNNYCLCYSEKINQFTSFLSYEGVFPMFNIDSKLFTIKNNKVWENFAGDYNMFYGEYQPYHITFISNDNPTVDKIFNNIEFRADCWDSNGLINKTFDTLEVWNEYQKGSTCLDNNIGPSPLKRKFRIWRANIPRDSHNMRDRIRNTWAYVKLSMKSPNKWRMEFHDLMVHYFI